MQNTGKVKAVENSTILHRRYEALTFRCFTCVTKIVMKTKNSTRLMCSHDRNYQKEKRKWNILQQHGGEMGEVERQTMTAPLTLLKTIMPSSLCEATKETNSRVQQATFWITHWTSGCLFSSFLRYVPPNQITT